MRGDSEKQAAIILEGPTNAILLRFSKPLDGRKDRTCPIVDITLAEGIFDDPGYVNYKIDDGPVVSMLGTGSPGQRLFLHDDKDDCAFFTGVRSGQRLQMEVRIYRHGREQVEIRYPPLKADF